MKNRQNEVSVKSLTNISGSLHRKSLIIMIKNDAITFDNLPEAVGQLLQEVSYIKNHLLNQTATSIEPKQCPAENEFLTVEDVCKKLRISKGGVYNLTCGRKIPFIKRGNRIYFDAHELNEWIRSDRRKTVKELQEEAYQSTRNNNNFSK